MWSTFLDTLRQQFENQVFAGGIALGLVGVLAASLRHLPGLLWSQLQRALVVTATLDSRNDLFPAFVGWLNDQQFGQKSRWFTVVKSAPEVAESEGADGDPAAGTDAPPALQYSPAPGFHLFVHRGRLMWLRRELVVNLQVVETFHLSALFAPRRLLEELLEGALRHAEAKRAHRLSLYTVDRWGEDWRLADSKVRRSLDSVVLDEGVAARLRDDIHGFFARREWYAQMGIPWRRGYLFHGPPGTGKTSVAYALAGELRLKLCTLSLTNPKLNDHSMAELLQRTPPRSLILIEDVDAFFVAREKQDARIEVSFSGLLNALDGVAAQEGRIVVLTTNHLERLDAALIRPGRIDVAVELGLATAGQLQGLFRRFFAQAQALAAALAADYPGAALSPAQIQQVLLGADTAEAAALALRAAWGAAPGAAPGADPGADAGTQGAGR